MTWAKVAGRYTKLFTNIMAAPQAKGVQLFTGIMEASQAKGAPQPTSLKYPN
jgi:hypothetical protein